MSIFATHSELILSLAKLTSVLLIAFAVDPFLKRSALRAAFWAGVLLILPIVLLATHGRSIVNILPQPSAAQRVETAPVVMAPVPSAPDVMAPAPAAPDVIPATQPLAATPSKKTVSQEISGVQESRTNWVAVVFFTGLALSLLPILISLLRIGFAPKRPANSDTLAIWESIRPEGMQTVALYVTSSPSAPFTAGLVRTAILLPESSAAWPLRRLRSTLHHEAAHIARRDILVRMAVSLVRAVLWFHPLVWLAHRKLVAAQEEACDEIALAAGIPPDEYAEDLLETAKHSQFAFAHSLHMARWSQLGIRIQTILRYKKPTHQPITMKTIATAILGITIVTCGLSTVGFSQDPGAAQAPGHPAQPPKSEAQIAMEKKLKDIMIPSIDWQDVPLEGVVDFLRETTARFDTLEKDPEKKGINFTLNLPANKPIPQVKQLKLKNVSAEVVLKSICDLTGLEYEVGESAVLIAPLGTAQAPGKPAQTPKPEAQTAMEKKLKDIMIPSIDWQDVPLEDVVDFLRVTTARFDTLEKDPEKKGINFTLNLPANKPIPQVKQLKLKNVSAEVVLKSICDLTGLEYEVGESAVLIAPLGTAQAKKAK